MPTGLEGMQNVSCWRCNATVEIEPGETMYSLVHRTDWCLVRDGNGMWCAYCAPCFFKYRIATVEIKLEWV